MNQKAAFRMRLGTAIAVVSSLLAAGAPSGAIAAVASNPPADASVIGGRDASIAEYPSLAFVGVEGSFVCTATVVAPRIVLTAGHCVEDLESRAILAPATVDAVTGVDRFDDVSPARISTVRRVLAFPGFKGPGLRGDAGLLVLDRPTSARPIALGGAADGALYAAGTRVAIAGWGATEGGDNDLSEQLQVGRTAIEDATTCGPSVRRFYRAFDPLTQFCARDVPKLSVAPCFGDSGGPAIARRPDGTMVEIGIVSNGDEGCNPGDSSIFTRVDSVSSWVEVWIAAVEGSGPEPPMRIPRVHKPTLHADLAESLTYFELEKDLGRRFREPLDERIECRRRSKARQSCDVSWRKRGVLYDGSSSVAYAIRRRQVVPVVHYKVRAVAESCVRGSAERRGCAVRTLRG